MKRSTPTLIICAAVLAAVAACTPTGSEEPASPESTSSAPADSEPSEDAAGESADEPSESPEAGDSDSDSDSDSEESTGSENEPGGSADRPEDSSVTVTLGGDTTVVEPTDVYCSGEPGSIEHIIGKTNNQLPLIEVSGPHFAMVKLDQRGAPEKTQDPQGISYGEDWVTFTDASVGSATLDGSMVCTAWED